MLVFVLVQLNQLQYQAGQKLYLIVVLSKNLTSGPFWLNKKILQQVEASPND